ncbi:hypothetical protein M948_03610 [Virgibacillus sp. CM-4]|uniref:Uncharacterized protein n=1 Tax=Virgibacillus massiliensis TaxID=1462526 RepID=A0A024Q956_9BACI|nr:hypothetical protein M948_03610 [Virgibacillus sp. CM-4]CDQ38822.1 hypothetical protein BN990_01097 [Virgibacillus massiliensis]
MKRLNQYEAAWMEEVLVEHQCLFKMNDQV